MQHSKLVEFGRIDQTADAGYFIRFLDEACAQESFQAYKRRTYELMEIKPGQRILEVGCGTGDDARTMAGMVGPRGHIVGLDNSEAMIAEANRRAAGLGLSLEFQVGDAMKMSFADNYFDSSRADRSFMHIPDPVKALSEMKRVTKPGGHILLYEVDFETVVIDAPNRPLARRIVNTWCDGFRNGWLGRHIPALFRELDIADVAVIPATLVQSPLIANLVIGPETVKRGLACGTIAPAEGEEWLNFMDDAVRTGTLFCTLGGFIVSGRKK
jgi:ubiquinone/menaquinone biosynthesis C-methylase UbiE